MLILPLLAALSSSVFNTFRFSFVKDLKEHNVSKSSINFWYRLLSLPLVLVTFWLSRESIWSLDYWFYVFFAMALAINIGYGYFQVWYYQKYPFSIAEGSSFLEIVFTFLLGFVFFSEKISAFQGVGLLIIFVSTSLFLYRYANAISITSIYGLIIFNLYSSVLNIANRQAIDHSSPIIYVLFVTFFMIPVFGFISRFIEKTFYVFRDKNSNKLLALVAICAFISFYSIAYAYSTLPVWIVSALLYLRVFLSLAVSAVKYKEKDMKFKIGISIIAFVGGIILTFGQ